MCESRETHPQHTRACQLRKVGVHRTLALVSLKNIKMKLACALAVILGVFTCQTGAQICASAEICPLEFPVRSDGGGACNSPEGDTVR